jgi:hypothetical protein
MARALGFADWKNGIWAAALAIALLLTSLSPVFCCCGENSAGLKQQGTVAAMQTPQDDCGCLCAGDHCACNHAGSIAKMAEFAIHDAPRPQFAVASAWAAPPLLIPQHGLFRPPRA